MKIFQVTPILNNQRNTITKDLKPFKSNINFTGNPKKPNSKIFKSVKKTIEPIRNKIIDGIAWGLSKILQLKFIENFIKKTKQCKNLYPHLSTTTSLVLSSFYIKRTLENDKLESDRKKTLAINQGIVCALSTIMAYTFDKIAGKKVNEFTNKFMTINFNKETPRALDNYKKGIRAASSMMIFGLMYRYIAPVLVTPIANHIGNKINKKKKIPNEKLNLNS